MSAAHNAYRLHALGPCALVEPSCLLDSPKVNGRALHALAAASLLLKPRGITSAFFGFTGEDEAGSILRRALMHLPIDFSYFRRYPGPSAQGLSHAGLAGLRLLHERAQLQPDWPDASCTQATWLLLDAPYYPQAHAESVAALSRIAQVAERARRRGVFCAVWFDAAGFAANAYAAFAHASIDLHIVSVGQNSDVTEWPQLSIPAATVIFLQPQAVRLHSMGGLYGKVQSEIAFSGEMNESVSEPLHEPTLIGALLAHGLFEIFNEDDHSRVDVNVDRERIEMQPLHLGLGFEWARLATRLSQRESSGIVSESQKGSWLGQVEQAWRDQHPERFTLWGGRHVLSR